ncbi:hypothetical protein CTRI78_v003113 [Colletotrichum trifolii]|uniref:Glycosyl transferase CAP10 domain-containing protein n=1 Tax=Colletotrichum trifolii TaxID=5466 RepID=A0A4R8RSV5_COLTR|nr:hypothetical protein CTRI78_v003113 [Colletotrichum trifolii]
MRHRQAARNLWPILGILTLCMAIYGLLFPSEVNLKGRPLHHAAKTGPNYDAGDFQDLHLDEQQCRAMFPGLTAEIDLAVAQGPFQLGINDVSASLLGSINNNELLIIQAPRPVDMPDSWKERQRAALEQINRAIVTSPTRLPDTFFNLYIQDTPVSNSWSYSRPVASSFPRHIFPMPHFAFWAWNQPFIRSIPRAAAAIQQIETTLPFHKKSARAVWRGTAWFNNGASSNPRSRQELLRVTKDASWADVQALEWINNGEDATNAINIADFCRYKYIIHTEGVSYSGRLHFHQMCESVLISPPMEWVQHTTHLARPVYSSVLLDSDAISKEGMAGGAKQPSEKHSRRAEDVWSTATRPEDANMIFVTPDWSDLEATVQWLENHPDVARGIAKRQRDLFVRHGYLGPAAEVCYWRALIKGWSQVVRVNETISNANATIWEEFSVRSEVAAKRP